MSSVRRITQIMIAILACGVMLFGGRSAPTLHSHSRPNKQTPTPGAASTPGTGFEIDDPLTDNSQGNEWQENNNCEFRDGAYHASEEEKNTIADCLSERRSFSNFAFIVRMKIIKGDCGGIAFRYNPTTSSEYVFDVCQDGRYRLYKTNSEGNFSAFAKGTSSLIHTGLGQENLVGVKADGEKISLYINNTDEPVTTKSDRTSSQGEIGVIANSTTDPTIVAYTTALLKAASASVRAVQSKW